LKGQKGTTYLRLSLGVICTALFALSVMKFQRDNWHESIVAFVVGLLAEYYYTSAWYETRVINKKKEEGRRWSLVKGLPTAQRPLA
jgi:uncharacterized membrane protein YjjP (DUF1212 family)